MSVNTAAGTRIFIGPEDQANLPLTISEYDALAWVELGEVEDAGTFGDQWNTQGFTALKDSRVRRFKTTRDAGETTFVVGFDGDDVGQTAFEMAVESKFNFPIRVELPDKQTELGNGTTFYFRSQVNSNRINVGGNDNVVRMNVNIAINSAVTRKASA